jgi:hypothetical protein
MTKYFCLLLVSLSNATVFTDNASLPREVTTPFPTITNLDVEWQIEGDDDLDAVYGVRFRIEGTQQWQIGLERPVYGPRP